MTNPTTFSIHKAVVTLDLSEADDSILNYLNFWVQNLTAPHLHFLHTIPKSSSLAAWLSWNSEAKTDANWVIDEAKLKKLEESVCQKIQSKEKLSLTYELESGDPLEKLLTSVDTQQADLLIMGRKADPNSYGIFARNVARRAPCSVLMVPQGAEVRLKTIVVPVDFSENSGKAIQTALNINTLLKNPAEIVVLNLYEIPDVAYYNIHKTKEQLRESVLGDVKEALQKFVKHYAGNFYDLIKLRVAEHGEDAIADTILSAAVDLSADLVVVGAKGHSLVERFLLGSVTERFLQINSKVCTLIIR